MEEDSFLQIIDFLSEINIFNRIANMSNIVILFISLFILLIIILAILIIINRSHKINVVGAKERNKTRGITLKEARDLVIDVLGYGSYGTAQLVKKGAKKYMIKTFMVWPEDNFSIDRRKYTTGKLNNTLKFYSWVRSLKVKSAKHFIELHDFEIAKCKDLKFTHKKNTEEKASYERLKKDGMCGQMLLDYGGYEVRNLLEEYYTSNDPDRKMMKNVAVQTFNIIRIMRDGGWSHNDIHDENLLVSDNGTIIIIDYSEVSRDIVALCINADMWFMIRVICCGVYLWKEFFMTLSGDIVIEDRQYLWENDKVTYIKVMKKIQSTLDLDCKVGLIIWRELEKLSLTLDDWDYVSLETRYLVQIAFSYVYLVFHYESAIEYWKLVTDNSIKYEKLNMMLDLKDLQFVINNINDISKIMKKLGSE